MLGTISKDIDLDNKEVAAEREATHPTFTQSPFVNTDQRGRAEQGPGGKEGSDNEYNDQQRPWDDHIVVRFANEVPWIDLILEIAMTTALANLIANTTISRGRDVFGYFCFWALTWWVWASEVAFNVRFRQADTLNRLAAILQLAIFGSLAAFTTDFDIFDGLGTIHTKLGQAEQDIQTQLNYSSIHSVHQHVFPQNEISVLNFRGISMTMALSRLLLMVQYLIVLLYALQARPQRPVSIHALFSTSASLLVHIISLLFSAILFFTAFGIVGHQPSIHDNVTKIILWYTALLTELVAHFVPPLLNLPGHVQYPPASLYSRASVLFIVVLGQELDKLTGTFRYIVGPTGFGVISTFLLISTGIILVGQFYFFLGSPSLKKRNSGGLLWFFCQFIYTMALIIFLSATADQLISFNLTRTQGILFDAALDIETRQNATMPRQLSDVPFNDSISFQMSGISAGEVADSIFFALQANGSDRDARLTRLKAEILGITYQQFDLYPSTRDPVYWILELVYNSTVLETNSTLSTGITELYNSTITCDDSTILASIISQLTRENIDSTKWFPASAGMTLFSLGSLRFIRQWPRDKWEWRSGLVLIVGGLVYIPLSIMDIGARQQIETFNCQSRSTHLHSAIWRFAISGWPIPSFAILTVLVMICDAACQHLARRSFRRKLASRSPETGALMEKIANA